MQVTSGKIRPLSKSYHTPTSRFRVSRTSDSNLANYAYLLYEFFIEYYFLLVTKSQLVNNIEMGIQTQKFLLNCKISIYSDNYLFISFGFKS